MTFDDRVRRHLQQAGSSLEARAGRLGDVQRRAQRRARRQQAAVGAMGASLVVAMVGLSVVMLSSGPGGDIDVVASGSLVTEAAAPAPSIQTLGSTIPVVTEAPSETGPPVSGGTAEVIESDGELTTPTSIDGDNTESGQAVLAATSTTEAGSRARWQQVTPPLDSVYVDYDLAAGVLVARTTNEWFVDFGAGWEALPQPPVDMVSVAVAVAPDGAVHLVGNLDDGPCNRRQVITAYDGESWSTTVIGAAQPPGVQSTLLHAELRKSPTVTVVSRVEELRIDPLCLIRSIGMEASEVRVVADGFELVDVDGDVVVLAAEDLELHQLVVALMDGPQRQRSVVWSEGSPGGDTTAAWRIETEPSWPVGVESVIDRANPVGVVGAEVVVVSGGGSRALTFPGATPLELGSAPADGYLVHDGLLVGWSRADPWVQWDGSVVTKVDQPLGIEDDGWIIDAVPVADGWAVLHLDGAETWIHTPTGDVALASLSGKEVPWGKLGSVAGDLRLVAESPVGPAVFGLMTD